MLKKLFILFVLGGLFYLAFEFGGTPDDMRLIGYGIALAAGLAVPK